MPKPFPTEFRAVVVRVVQQRDPGVAIAQIAAVFGVSTSCVQRWLDEEAKKASPVGRVAAAESVDLREAKRRIRLLEQENEVLRRAAAYLSQANLPGE